MSAIGIGLSPIFGAADLSYLTKALGLAPANLIAYWVMNEASGVTADNAEGTAARDGTYTGVTLNSTPGPDGLPSGLWDGANDYCHVYSASLDTAFNRSEGTLAIWSKVRAASVWTDSTARYLVDLSTSASVERFRLARASSDNRLQAFLRNGGGLQKQININGISVTDWFHLAMTWSQTDDEFIAYYAGSAVGAPTTGLDAPGATNLLTTTTVIGSLDTVPASVWDGYLAHCGVWDTPLSAAQILKLATI